MKAPVTYLFVPGTAPERFAKALASGADAIVLDLEDAVAPDRKDEARGHIHDWLVAHRADAARVVVRINDAASPWFAADLALLRTGLAARVMLPKAEAPAAIAPVAAELPEGGLVLPLVESALGVRDVDAIAAAPGVERLVFGSLDYGVDLDLSNDPRGLAHPSAAIAIASRCAGILRPVAGVTPAIDDDEALRADVAFARAFGFTAKLCIHPRQVAVVRQAMAPTPDEILWAQRVLAASASIGGVAVVDGRMVDRPVVLRAESILDRAGT